MSRTNRLGKCTYCGREGVLVTRDHIIPKSRGGTDDPENLTDACEPCNGGKGNRLLSELPLMWWATAVHQELRQRHGVQYADQWLADRAPPSWIRYADEWASRNLIAELIACSQEEKRGKESESR